MENGDPERVHRGESEKQTPRSGCWSSREYQKPFQKC